VAAGLGSPTAVKPRDHALLGAAAAALLLPRLGRRSVAFMAGSVLIDVDHAAEYAWWTGGRVSFPRGFGRFQDRLWEQVRRPEYLVLNPLHTLECFATVALLGRSRPWLRALLLGMVFHRSARPAARLVARRGGQAGGLAPRVRAADAPDAL
jgi:hypothetical protein